MASKFFRLLILAMGVLCFLTVDGFAASVHQMNYFQTSTVEKDGRNVLRIEFGVDRDDLEYKETVKPYLPRCLILDLKNTNPGKLKDDIHLKNELARRVRIQELEINHTQISIDMNMDATEDTYKVYTLPAERKAKKPYRLVVEIAKPMEVSGEKLDGLKGHTVVLDAGHGGSDSGAVGPHGVMEKDVTLAVTKKVQEILKNSGSRVIMTRETDRDVYGINATDRQELQARVNVGLYAPEAEIFLSIHCNAFSNPSAHGMETYYYAGSYRGKRLASLLNEELEKAGGLANRGVKTANFYVMKYSAVPASLIELGFITNYNEESLLNDDEYQMKLAFAIAKALSRYFQE